MQGGSASDVSNSAYVLVGEDRRLVIVNERASLTNEEGR